MPRATAVKWIFYLGKGEVNWGTFLLTNGDMVCSAKTPPICNFPTIFKPEYRTMVPVGSKIASMCKCYNKKY